MNILIACEESQEVCKAFRARGQNAFSCDIQECSGGHKEWHIKNDVLKIIEPVYKENIGKYESINFNTQDGKEHSIEKWDMIIAHPPCTYLTNAAARHLYPKGIINKDRMIKGFAAKEFFMTILNARCEKICIENPVPSKVFELPKYTQIIQPYEYGHPYKKRTCLWIKNLPLLQPTKILEIRESTKIAGNWYNKGGKERQKNRSKTFQGIAEAMAAQWC